MTPEMDRTPTGVLKQAALGKARLNHAQTACDDFTPAAESGDRERVYCESCGEVLLRWGGET